MADFTLRKKYNSKLLTRLIQFIASVALMGLVPRSLGPVNLGIYDFLNSFFGNISRFLNLETGQAYFTKLSKRQSEFSLIGFIIIFNLVVFFIAALSLFIIVAFGFQEKLFNQINLILILFSLILTFLLSYASLIRLTHDALGTTIKIEKLFLFQSLISAGLILILYRYHILNINTYFSIQIFNQLLILIPGIFLLVSTFKFKKSDLILSKNKIINYCKEFYHFCHPLVFYAFCVVFIGIADRLILLEFGGLVDQGLFGFSYKVSELIFIIPSAMSVLIFRELSISVEKNKQKKIRVLLTKNLFLFYFIASYFAVFISQNSEYITSVIGGEKFFDAAPVLSVLAFYPLHQVYGQYLGSLLLSFNKTQIIKNVGILSLMFGLALSIYFIGPEKYNFKQLGALGYAYKMIIYQIFMVNIYLVSISKLVKIEPIKFVLHQIYVVVFLYLIQQGTENFLENKFSDSNITFFVSGVLYSMFCVILIYAFPRIIGFNRIEILRFLKIFK